MALGGGTWLFQNKKLPGTYINFISKDRPVTDIADRGYAAMALDLDWGISGAVFRVEAEDFQKNCQKIFGYDYGHDKMKPLRDLFINLKTGYFYRLNSGGEKAKNTLATAKYAGIRGNSLSTAVQSDPDNSGKFIVYTYLTTDGMLKTVDKQSNVSKGADLQDNDFVVFSKTATLTEKAAESLTGGTNGTAVTVSEYHSFIEHIEPYYFNILGYAGSDETVQSLLINFTKRCRENTGSKFQLVIYGKTKVNYPGVISIKNNVTDTGAEKGSLVYWLTGKEAACAINASCTNAIYDGEYTVNTNFKQYELEQAVSDGMFMFHNVSDSVSGNVLGDTRVLTDINTFTEVTKAMNKDFTLNQVIRVLDNAAIDIARLFNRIYLGKVQNDADGRISLWKDGIALFEEYQRVRAIQNFVDDDLPVPTQGEEKTAVLWTFEIQPTACMEKLYCTVVVA